MPVAVTAQQRRVDARNAVIGIVVLHFMNSVVGMRKGRAVRGVATVLGRCTDATRVLTWILADDSGM